MAKEVLIPLIHSEILTVPSTPSAGNVVVYAEGGVLKIKDSSGNVTQTLNPAGSENIITSSLAPTINDDSSGGAFIGQRWIREFASPADNVAYICLDATVGAAFWYLIASSGITVNEDGDIVFNAPVIFESGVAFNSVYLTNIFTGNQNNLLIPDMKNYTTIIFRSTIDINVTGINATGIVDWNAHIFVNGNSNGKKFTFKAESASSTASNRFSGANDISLNQGEFWWFIRNVAISRWSAQAKI